MKIGILKRFNYVFILSLTFYFLIIFIAISSVISSYRNMDYIKSLLSNEIYQINSAKEAAISIENYLTKAVLYEDKEELENYINSIEANTMIFELSLNEMWNYDTEQIFESFNHSKIYINGIYDFLYENRTEEANKLIQQEYMPINNQIKSILSDLKDATTNKLYTIYQKSDSLIYSTGIILLIFLVLYIVIIFIFYINSKKSIVKPINEIKIFSEQIAKENFEFNSIYYSNDEFGEICDNMRKILKMCKEKEENGTYYSNDNLKEILDNTKKIIEICQEKNKQI